MHKVTRITINLLIFAVVIGFAGYIINRLVTGESFFGDNLTNGSQEGISPYKRINAIKTKSEIIRFDLSDEMVFIATKQAVMIHNKDGSLVQQITTNREIRDIKVEDNRIYLLYPAEIEVYAITGEKITGWKASRNNSDYCSMTLSSEFIFVTDVGNKQICKFSKEGEFMAVILSPSGFIIPSFAFDIINIGDTIYCSNSGRHRIEVYSLVGEYIRSFGTAGSESGHFAGCCNPVYLAATSNGDILTSEKGNPRISCFDRDGRFKAILLGSKALGRGTTAYSVKAIDDKLYVAGKKTLSEYVYDPDLAAQSACNGCPSDCPLRK